MWQQPDSNYSKLVRDMRITYIQMHRTNKISYNSSIIWPVWLNGWVFFYELSGCGFECSCINLNFRFCTCFEQGGRWHSGNYRVWTHSETCTWHDKNIQSNGPVIVFLIVFSSVNKRELQTREKCKSFPFMYWMPKLPCKPSRSRSMIVPSQCSTKSISLVVSKLH